MFEKKGPRDTCGAEKNDCQNPTNFGDEPQEHSAPVSPTLARALGFAEAGVAVFACRPHDEVDANGRMHAAKSPYTARGHKDATTNELVIRSLWQRWSDALIGIPTGKASGTVTADVDVKNIYGYPDGVEKIASRNDVLPGVDIKAEGGYIIAWNELGPDNLKALTPYPLALEDAFQAAKRSNGSTQRSPTPPGRHAPMTMRREDLAREYERAREWLADEGWEPAPADAAH